MNAMDVSPLRVIVTRGVPESEHIVDAVVADSSAPTMIWGDAGAPMNPRSAIKSIQALPLILSGAADAFDVSDIELALAASSHSAEPAHLDAVEAWLRRIGLGPEALECGADRPIDAGTADKVLADGGSFTAVHNCCSGKHAGFLTLAAHLGVEARSYIERGHPVQALVTDAVGLFTGVDLKHAANGRDGCGIPTFSFPASRLAEAMARIASPDDLNAETGAAVRRLGAVLEANPWWVSGSGRPEVTFAEAASERVILKGGAEGVFMGALPERGLGIIVKARDGSRRAGDAAMAAVLEQLGVVSPGLSTTKITNAAGSIVGEQRVWVP